MASAHDQGCQNRKRKEKGKKEKSWKGENGKWLELRTYIIINCKSCSLEYSYCSGTAKVAGMHDNDCLQH